ncbi:nuclear pore glycoprotein p62-like [Belonocnema kinseyi]|uniref:nuclear pore glycoprotein p62-like n=1 Tax=Belonocnema kinseyi TaxID=2817044 RepID=UPI00143D6F42|nr:nuclear pore glycoprotein p62-like [Belonocnema kinseyi]
MTTSASGFTLGTTVQSTAPGFNLAKTAPLATQGISGMQTPGMGTPQASLGTTPAQASTGFSLTGGTPSAGTGFTLGNTPQTTSTSFNLGGTTPSTGFSLGGTVATPTTGFNLGATPAATSATGFNLGGTASTASTGFNLGGTTSTTATGFNLGGTTTSASGFNLGAAAPTTATGFTINKTTAPPAPASIASSTPQTTLGATTTVSTSSGSGQTGAINFCQLEESINKYTLELEEQEKVFVNQATQVNAWDKLLISNGEKIVTLNQEVERVKLEQQQLEHELDYVVGQQKELQDCLVPLEKELSQLSVSDPEREYTYRLAESLDTQLKQMSEDLKEIIEHLNEANRAQDSSDPIVQIGKILNAHMNSLQWLDQRTTLLGQKIQQIDQMHQNFRQENERSFNLAYN